MDIYLKQIAEELAKWNTKTDWPSWLVAGATIILGIVAIFQDRIRSLFFKSNVYPYEKQYNFKQIGVLITRLKVINNGKETAKNATFVIEGLSYVIENKEYPANNFCSYPLKWTHRDETDVIDLYRNRPYYLDLCEVIIDELPPRVRICSPFGDPLKNSGLDDLKKGDNILRISMYCDNQKKKEYKIYIYWTGDAKDFIKIKKFVRVLRHG